MERMRRRCNIYCMRLMQRELTAQVRSAIAASCEEEERTQRIGEQMKGTAGKTD
jgi:hypothetical protein